MTTRRELLGTAIGLGALMALPSVAQPAPAPTVLTRYSATSANGKLMLAKYASAVDLMMQKKADDPRSWNFQWYSHWIPGPQSPWDAVIAAKTNMLQQIFPGVAGSDPNLKLAAEMWDTCQPHGANPADPTQFQSTYFLPWHRLFVARFENIVRAVLQDPQFTLPYWDYLSGNESDLSIPPEFRDDKSPLFRKGRNSWINSGQRMDIENPGALSLDALNEQIYDDNGIGLCPIVNNNPHGVVHDFVGDDTNMGAVPYAAGDPIFWLHHCNVDRIWASWNRAGRQNPTWQSRNFTFADAMGNRESVAANETLTNVSAYDTYIPVAAPLAIAANARPGSRSLAVAGMTRLGSTATRVPLPNANAHGGAGSSLLRAAANELQTYLVFSGVMTDKPPRGTFNVFLDLPAHSPSPRPGDPHFVGTLSFFGAVHMDMAAGTTHSAAYNVTRKARELANIKLLAAESSVTLIPAGTLASGANPMIARTELLQR